MLHTVSASSSTLMALILKKNKVTWWKTCKSEMHCGWVNLFFSVCNQITTRYYLWCKGGCRPPTYIRIIGKAHVSPHWINSEICCEVKMTQGWYCFTKETSAGPLRGRSPRLSSWRLKTLFVLELNSFNYFLTNWAKTWIICMTLFLRKFLLLLDEVPMASASLPWVRPNLSAKCVGSLHTGCQCGILLI